MNLGQILRESASRNPQKPAIISGEKVVPYSALDHGTDALANWLLRQGLAPGDRLAIHWCNSVETVSLLFACFKTGIIAVPINLRLKAPEVGYILGHSKAKLCFSEPELAPLSESVRDQCPDLQGIHTSLPALDPSAKVAGLPEVTADRVAAILYTSGTTAQPKGVMHTHVSLTGAAQLMHSLGVGESDTCLAAAQLAHASALMCALLPAISAGGTTVLLPAFDAAVALNHIERWKCTYIGFLPTMIRFLVEEQERQQRKVGTLRICISGGDTVPVALQERFRRLFGIPVRELYGMTESVPITWIRDGESMPGSVGRAGDAIDTRVVDLDGNIAADGVVGEMQVQSPANCVGYWEDPGTTAQTFDHGWLRTGDLVRRDTDGFFWFEGRLKQLIIRGGSNISPQEVEEALYRHPAVLEAGVIGMPDPVYGEKVIAFVTLRDEVTATEEELRAFARGRIADYKIPERICFLAALPKGITGKVQRRELKTIAQTLPQFSATASA
jgi:long-chain acyl-CoA synthetase